MDRLRKIVAVLTLSAIVLAVAAPALAQTGGMPMASPTVMPGRTQGGMQSGMQSAMQDAAVPVEQSDKGMMATLRDTKDTGMAASIMKMAGLEGVTTPEGRYTLFVASDAALKATNPAVMDRMKEGIKDRQMAMDFVKGHLIDGAVMPDQMTDGKTLTMMNGKTMTVRKTDGRMMVDDASIIKAVKTGNGMIYVMDKIPASIMAIVERPGMTGTMPMSARPASR